MLKIFRLKLLGCILEKINTEKWSERKSFCYIILLINGQEMLEV
nr:MAG TPA: hypothetical protein [Caudoviricetes sp.]